MKRIMLSLLAFLSFGGAGWAQKLTIEDVEVRPGTTASFALMVDAEGGEYSGFQFEMQFPETGFSTTGNAAASQAWQGGTLFVGDLTLGAGRVSALSTSDKLIPDGALELGMVEFLVDEDVPLGDYEVTISAFKFLDGTNYTPVDDVTFQVKVVNALHVVLDENSVVAPEAAEGVNAIVKRTIKAGSWSSIVLPFGMSADQVATAFGNDAKLADFAGCDTQTDANDRVVGIQVKFLHATSMEAHHPYLIQIQNDVTEFTVDGVNIAPAPQDELAVDRDECAYSYKVGSKTYTGYMYNRFVGTYVAGTPVPEYALFLSGNQFWYSTGATLMKAFRAYFDFYDVLTDVEEDAASRITMSFADVTTGVSSRPNHHEGGPVYDLQGRRVVEPVKGLYITGGKKVVIK